MVIKAGWGNTGNALLELADVGIDDDVRTSVQKAAAKALASDAFGSSKVEVRNIQGIKAGQSLQVDVELAVPEDWTLKDMRPVEDAVRERIGSKVRGARRVKVRFVSTGSGVPDFVDEFIGAEVSPRSSPEPEDEHDHGHEHSHEANGDLKKRL